MGTSGHSLRLQGKTMWLVIIFLVLMPSFVMLYWWYGQVQTPVVTDLNGNAIQNWVLKPECQIGCDDANYTVVSNSDIRNISLNYTVSWSCTCQANVTLHAVPVIQGFANSGLNSSYRAGAVNCCNYPSGIVRNNVVQMTPNYFILNPSNCVSGVNATICINQEIIYADAFWLSGNIGDGIHVLITDARIS